MRAKSSTSRENLSKCMKLSASCRLSKRLEQATHERDTVLNQAQVLGLHLGQLTEPLLHILAQDQLPDTAETTLNAEKARAMLPNPAPPKILYPSMLSPGLTKLVKECCRLVREISKAMIE